MLRARSGVATPTAALQAAAAAGWQPSDLAGGGRVILAYDFKDTSKLFQTADTSTPAGNGNPVHRINEMYGGAPLLVPGGTSTKRGTYEASTGSIILDGADDCYVVTFAPGVTDKLTAICKFALYPDDTDYNSGIMSYWSGLGSEDYDRVDSAQIFFYGVATIRGTRNSVNTSNASFSGAAFHTLMSQFDGTNETKYIDGTGLTPVASAGNFAASGTLAYGGKLAGSNTPSATPASKIGRMIVIGGGAVLSSGERASALTWINA